MYRAIPTTNCSEQGVRYIVIDGFTGKVLDNADGHGYRSEEAAYAGFAQKHPPNAVPTSRRELRIAVARYLRDYPEMYTKMSWITMQAQREHRMLIPFDVESVLPKDCEFLPEQILWVWNNYAKAKQELKRADEAAKKKKAPPSREEQLARIFWSPRAREAYKIATAICEKRSDGDELLRRATNVALYCTTESGWVCGILSAVLPNVSPSEVFDAGYSMPSLDGFLSEDEIEAIGGDEWTGSNYLRHLKKLAANSPLIFEVEVALVTAKVDEISGKQKTSEEETEFLALMQKRGMLQKVQKMFEK